MIIRNITIQNFQSYYNEQSLDFSEGLNLIIGNGGKGKSKLFNAFYWVLFGKIYITSNGWCATDLLPYSSKMAMKKHEFINKKALFEANINEEVTASVKIEIEDDKGFKYSITRSASAIKQNEKNWDTEEAWNVRTSILKIESETITGTRSFTDFYAEDKINNLFPEGIRNYIWFQGESLDSLINFRKKETLKDAVKHISYYPFYEKLSKIISISKDKIDTIEKRKLRDANKNSSALKELLSSSDSLKYKIEKEESEKNKLESDINTINIALSEDENKLNGLAKHSGLVAKYKECEAEVKACLTETTRIDNFQREKLPTLWVLRGIEPMIKDCKDIIENHKKEEYTVPEKKYLDNPSRSKLEEIIRDKKCFVCGTEFSEEDLPFHYITERLKLQDEYFKEMEEFTNNMQLSKQFNMFVGKIQDYPDSLLISLSRIDKQWKDSENELDKYLIKRRKKKDELDKLELQIDEVKKKYGVDPVQQAQAAGNIETGIKASRSNKSTLTKKLENSKQELNRLKSELRNTERDLEKLNTKENGLNKVSETEWKKISIFLEDICKRVQENARRELLSKIEERANIFYTKFTEHDNGYKGNVKIGDDYSIDFDPGLNTSHEDRKKMSIINALLALNQEAMDIYYPFISDAPTSSFDIETTHKYLMGIKDIFGQSIIMTKDIDIQNDKYSELINQSNIAKVYALESEIYVENTMPDLHEVSTKVRILKQ